VRDVSITNDLDAQLAALPKDEALGIHLSGSLVTQGVYRAGQFASRNLGTGWTVDGDAEISLVSPVGMDSQLLCLLSGPAQSVNGLSFRGNQSKLAPTWQGPLRTGAVWLDGDGAIDHVAFHDFGAIGKETFVAVVAEGFGRASITNYRFTDFVPSASDTQVSVSMIAGEYEMALMETNDTDAPRGWVQAHTIYRAKNGIVRNNKTKCRIGYYADYFGNKNRTIVGNEFTEAEYGIQLQLSPTGENGIDPAYFFHEIYTIGPNVIQSTGPNVLLDPMGPQTATRYMRNFQIDAGLTMENRGATGVVRTGVSSHVPDPARKGCRPFGFFRS
jgi:hypothetical protein